MNSAVVHPGLLSTASARRLRGAVAVHRNDAGPVPRSVCHRSARASDCRRYPGRSGHREPGRDRSPPRSHCEHAGSAGPPARRAVRRDRLPRQCRRLLRSGEQLPAGRPADASRAADHAGADLQVRRRGRGAESPRHQCARPFSGSRRGGRRMRTRSRDCENGCSSIRSMAATMLDEAGYLPPHRRDDRERNACRRRSGARRLRVGNGWPGCSPICRRRLPPRGENATSWPCRNCSRSSTIRRLRRQAVYNKVMPRRTEKTRRQGDRETGRRALDRRLLVSLSPLLLVSSSALSLRQRRRT